MSLSGKLVSELVINGPAERFYKVFREKCFLVPKICPNAIQEVDIHDAEWDNHDHGSIKTWYYTVGMHFHVSLFLGRITFLLNKN